MWKHLVDVVRERRAEETLQRHNTAVGEMEERILELRETVECRDTELSIALIISEEKRQAMDVLQEELESWVKMETFVCEEGRCPNEIDARLSMMCEMCGALNKSEVEKLLRRMEGDRERRLETARRVVMRMQRRQLAMALDTFGARTAAAKARRERMDRLVRRMMHAEMARAFDGLREGVEQERGRREMVARAIGRWSRPAAFGMFEMWKYLVDVVRERRAEETLQRHNTAVEEMEERILELRETVECRDTELSMAGRGRRQRGRDGRGWTG